MHSCWFVFSLNSPRLMLDADIGQVFKGLAGAPSPSFSRADMTMTKISEKPCTCVYIIRYTNLLNGIRSIYTGTGKNQDQSMSGMNAALAVCQGLSSL